MTIHAASPTTICGECYADHCWRCEGDCDCTHPPLDYKCAGCDESFALLPVIDSENGQAYCSERCRDRESERYWTAVWTA